VLDLGTARACGQTRPAWPGNAVAAVLDLGTARACERRSASGGATRRGLRGRRTQLQPCSIVQRLARASDGAPAEERPDAACVAGERSNNAARTHGCPWVLARAPCDQQAALPEGCRAVTHRSGCLIVVELVGDLPAWSRSGLSHEQTIGPMSPTSHTSLTLRRFTRVMGHSHPRGPRPPDPAGSLGRSPRNPRRLQPLPGAQAPGPRRVPRAQPSEPANDGGPTTARSPHRGRSTTARARSRRSPARLRPWRAGTWH